MMGTPVTEQVARSFLLGDVDASEQERIESLFLSDREIRETILMVEDSLLEDYLEEIWSRAIAKNFAPLRRKFPRA